MSLNFDASLGEDGQIRTSVWDRFTTWGSKFKEGQETRFDEETLGQMTKNWRKRGDALAMDHNHQSSYASENGQPAPALAWYNALVVVRNGQCIAFEKLDDSSAVEPPQVAAMSDGLWGYRSEVTPLGQELLPNFKYLSPTFSPEGTDEQGLPIGYVLHAVAATNTPFQSGTGITFDKGKRKMATKFEEDTMAKLGLEPGADDDAVKTAYAKKMEEGAGLMASGSPEDCGKMAEEMAELAGHYAAVFGGEDEGPHVAMKAMAGRLSKLSAADKEEEPAKMEKDDKDGDEKKMEAGLCREYTALASRLNVKLPSGANARQMFDAISASTVPAAQLSVMVESRVKQAMMERDQQALKASTADKAKALVAAAIEGGYPESQKSALLSFASDPKSYDAAEAMVKPFLGGVGENSVLFSRMTASGAPIGQDPRKLETANGGKDRRVVRNELATFVIEGEKFSNLAKEWADAKDGPMKMEIDGLLSDSEQSHAGYRLIAANRLLKAKRPELWAAAEEQDL